MLEVICGRTRTLYLVMRARLTYRVGKAERNSEKQWWMEQKHPQNSLWHRYKKNPPCPASTHGLGHRLEKVLEKLEKWFQKWFPVILSH